MSRRQIWRAGDGMQGQPSRGELVLEVKELFEEMVPLKRYLRRKPTQTFPIPPPEEREELLGELVEVFVDWGLLPGHWEQFNTKLDEMKLQRNQLRGSVARRNGPPDGRRQNRSEWERWEAESPLSFAVGIEREWARNLLQSGKTYEETLHWVGNAAMLGDGKEFTRSRAQSIKKSVDREYLAQRRQKPPAVPRGWWHRSDESCSRRIDGQALKLAWCPNVQPHDTQD